MQNKVFLMIQALAPCNRRLQRTYWNSLLLPVLAVLLGMQCLATHAATDPEPRTLATPINAIPLDDVEKPEPEDTHARVPTPQDAHVPNPKDADVVELPSSEKPDPKPVVKADPTPPAKPEVATHVKDSEPTPKIDTGLDEDLIKERQRQTKLKTAAVTPSPLTGDKKTPKPLEHVPPATPPDVRLALPSKPVTEPGYASVLSGTLQASTELNAESLPHLIRGVLVIPAKMTLKINAGAIVHLRSDTNAAKPLLAGSPDPSKSAAVWVYGSLVIAGDNAHPVELAGQDKDNNANVLLYSAEQSKVEGVRFKGTDMAQNGGVCQWTNCEFNDSKYYALASGAAQFTHCTFNKCGGIFAAYEEGPWALLVRRCLFENCRDGLLLNRDPGQACLLIERNNFIGTRGANLRAMPRAGTTNSKTAEELLIGENWYGTTIEEDIDRRIVDRRTDPTIKAHLNTRPPSEKPYGNTGAGVPQASIINTLNDQQAATTRMLTALAAKQKLLSDRARVAMEKTAMLPKEAVKKD